MARRDSLIVNDQPDEIPDPLTGLARLLARQAAAEALSGAESGGDAAAGTGEVETAEAVGAADLTEAAAPAGGRRE